MRTRLCSALAYTALVAAALISLPGAGACAAIAVAAAVVLSWSELTWAPRGIFLAMITSVTLALALDPALLPQAADNLARLTGLILSVILLSSVLGKTRDLQRISTSLFNGRPRDRYISLAAGTTLLSIPLNVGSVAIVGSLVANRVQQRGDSAATRNATRATLRGFGVAPIFSPLSISVVLTLTLLPQLSSLSLLAIATPWALVILAAGLLWREKEINGDSGGQEQAGLAPWLRFAGIIVTICIGVFVLSHFYRLSYGRAVTLSCLIVTAIGWLRQLAVARRQPQPGGGVGLPDLSQTANQLAIVGGSAFTGAILSGAILALWGSDAVWPAWAWPLVAAVLPWLYFATGMVGVNPIVSGTLAGGILGAIWPPEALPGLGIAMVSGWGITAFGTPYSANALLMEKISGYPAWVASWQWNRKLSLFSLTGSSLLAAILSWVSP